MTFTAASLVLASKFISNQAARKITRSLGILVSMMLFFGSNGIVLARREHRPWSNLLKPARSDEIKPNLMVNVSTSFTAFLKPNTLPLFFLISSSRKVAYPVDVLVYIELTNISPYPIRVDECFASSTFGPSTVRLIRIPSIGHFLVYAKNASKAIPWQFKEPTLEEAVQLPIEARRKTGGWAYFSYPNGNIAVPTEIHVTDDYGVSAKGYFPRTSDLESSLQGETVLPSRLTFDLSTFQVHRWDKRF